jgi:hypothetical protein
MLSITQGLWVMVMKISLKKNRWSKSMTTMTVVKKLSLVKRARKCSALLMDLKSTYDAHTHRAGRIAAPPAAKPSAIL